MNAMFGKEILLFCIFIFSVLYWVPTSGFLFDTVEPSYKGDNRPFLPKYPGTLLNLSVTYNSTAFNFTSCCKTYNYRASFLNLNSIGDHIVNSADVRTENVPTITWDQEKGVLYTLVALDPDNGPPVGTESFPFMHYQVINIRDGVQSGNLIISYNGPVPPFGQTHTIYFLLYRQNGYISPTNTGIYAGRNCGPGGPRCFYDINAFVKENNLQLVGVKRMRVQTDPYVRYFWITQFGSPEKDQCKNVPGYSDPCKAIPERPFLPVTSGLTTTLDIRYHAPALNFTSCCKSYSYPSSTLSLNMLGDQYANTVDVRTGLSPPTISWGSGHDNEYAKGMYALLMVDPDNTPPVGTESNPFLHYQVLNIQNGLTGNETVGYTGPNPPFGQSHVIYFLLYRQSGFININTASTYAGQNCGPNRGRCMYDIDRFVKENDLKLIAVKRMKVKTDPFSQYVWTTIYGGSVDQHCHSVPGYSNPCKVMIERPFLPRNDTGMSVELNIDFSTKNLTIQSCCRTYFYPKSTLELNHMENKLINTALVRTGSAMSINWGQGHVSDNLYTILVIDPDNSSPVGTESKPFIHYQVLNIRKYIMSTGDEIVSYIGPAPPGGQTHKLYFLLYQQIGYIVPSSAKTYAGENCGPNAGRCMYDINKFVAINKLHLVGYKTMTVHTDPYTRYVWTSVFGSPMTQQCQNVPGYNDPCIQYNNAGLSSGIFG